MFQAPVQPLSNVHRALILGLSLSAAAGWGSFVVSKYSSAGVQHQLRSQLAGLQEAQTQLLSERTRAQTSLSEMAQLRIDLTSARKEIARLSQPRDQSQAELHPVRPAAKGQGLQSNGPGDDVSKTGAIGTKAIAPPPIRTVSGENGSKQRNQQTATTDSATQGPQKANEKSQRSKAMTVAAELDTAGLRQLTKSTDMPAQR
jgi:hypothetical protein